MVQLIKKRRAQSPNDGSLASMVDTFFGSVGVGVVFFVCFAITSAPAIQRTPPDVKYILIRATCNHDVFSRAQFPFGIILYSPSQIVENGKGSFRGIEVLPDTEQRSADSSVGAMTSTRWLLTISEPDRDARIAVYLADIKMDASSPWVTPDDIRIEFSELGQKPSESLLLNSANYWANSITVAKFLTQSGDAAIPTASGSAIPAEGKDLLLKLGSRMQSDRFRDVRFAADDSGFKTVRDEASIAQSTLQVDYYRKVNPTRGLNFAPCGMRSEDVYDIEVVTKGTDVVTEEDNSKPNLVFRVVDAVNPVKRDDNKYVKHAHIDQLDEFKQLLQATEEVCSVYQRIRDRFKTQPLSQLGHRWHLAWEKNSIGIAVAATDHSSRTLVGSFCILFDQAQSHAAFCVVSPSLQKELTSGCPVPNVSASLANARIDLSMLFDPTAGANSNTRSVVAFGERQIVVVMKSSNGSDANLRTLQLFDYTALPLKSDKSSLSGTLPPQEIVEWGILKWDGALFDKLVDETVKQDALFAALLAQVEENESVQLRQNPMLWLHPSSN